MTGRKQRSHREADHRDEPERSQRPYRDDADAYGPRRRYTQDDRGYGQDDWAQPEPRPVYPAARPEDRGQRDLGRSGAYGEHDEASWDRQGGRHAGAREGERGESSEYDSWEDQRYGEGARERGGRLERGWQEGHRSGYRGDFRGSYADDYWGGSFASGPRGGPGRGRGPLPGRGGRLDEDGDGSTDEGPYYRGHYTRRAQPYYTRGGSGVMISETWTLDGPHTGRGPKGYKRSDEQIVEEASRRLERHGGVDASEIEVSCEDGVVTLQGTVAERGMKRSAEECIEDVYGVQDVMNQLRVDRGASAGGREGEHASSGESEQAEGGGQREASRRSKPDRSTRSRQR